jgi:DNA invertase Pin-like site-specific DNA recombinase
MAKAANRKATSGRRVYSYIRFSTPDQALGDSERRQLDAAKDWADKNNHVLDDKLRLVDRGMSGYSGAHRKKGALGEFLKMVEAGDVPSGSILLVENIDRLSREDFMQAFETVTQIISKGVSIQTLQPYAEYTRDSIKGGMVYQLVGQMQRAYEESARKSVLMRASRQRERELAQKSKRVLTKQGPAWLVMKPDRSGFDVVKGAKETINRIFKLKLKGLGINRIEVLLNAGSAWTPPKSVFGNCDLACAS